MNTRSFIIVRALLSYRYYIICHNNITSLSCRIQLKQRSESYLTVYPVKSTKTHVFITPNRYAVLNRDKDKVLTTPSTSTTEDPDRPSHKAYKVHNAKPVAPPINIKNISNFSAFNTVLNNITGPNGFICKSTLSYLILQPTDKRTYNAIIDHLHETSASFHLFPPPSYPTYKVIIKNLHNSTLHTDITSALTELGHSVKSIYNAKNRKYSSWISVSNIITTISMILHLFSTQ
ncbi:Uncharacterized protein FWK35_00004074 [Aphis craccivora]|uniref:Pre-C2HC domain-containing protein n=1 Tax=Aphis craccivora TaxID=307492 RepID=A0A6G0ZQT3_APHCR|nr:Uncharacterized protein FWK35_00004074 [Aphis craccivora]